MMLALTLSIWIYPKGCRGRKTQRPRIKKRDFINSHTFGSLFDEWTKFEEIYMESSSFTAE